jgi:transposase
MQRIDQLVPTGGDVQILSATVSEQAGHWYVSLQVEQEQTVPENTDPVVGIDLGVKSLATLSDGEVIRNPRHLKRRLGNPPASAVVAVGGSTRN